VSDRAEGLLLVDKPAGITSHDVVLTVRRVYGEKSIGHLGTLDPFATGLLVLLIGRFTRLANFIENEPKVYEAAIRFGSETDTDDSTGTITRECPPPSATVINAAICRLTGDIDQVPPDFSAKSVGGTRAYSAARKGATLELSPVKVRVHEWKVRSFADDVLHAEITCGSGTYVRALARDLGRLTDSAAHLESLRRIRSGAFDVGDAVSLDQLKISPPPLRVPRVIVGD
jgi:tRNA pseudouridine55 synthase